MGIFGHDERADGSPELVDAAFAWQSGCKLLRKRFEIEQKIDCIVLK